jgi:magnesium-transporting ATPase (P-type)
MMITGDAELTAVTIATQAGIYDPIGTHSPTHSPTHSLTNSLTHSLT